MNPAVLRAVELDNAPLNPVPERIAMKRLALAATLSTALAVAAASAEAVPPNATPTTAATGGTTRKAENGTRGASNLANMDTPASSPATTSSAYVNGGVGPSAPGFPPTGPKSAWTRDAPGRGPRAACKAILLEEAAAEHRRRRRGAIRRKIGDWYASYMDEAAIEKAAGSRADPARARRDRRPSPTAQQLMRSSSPATTAAWA
jgi:putative endopeptidase